MAIDTAQKYFAEAAAISAADAIMFSLTLNDHFERTDWLNGWVHGEWRVMRKDFPEFALNKWRTQ